MNENIDQFGRSNNNQGNDKILDNVNSDQSKKIKQSLAEIKEQLIQENFKIQNNDDQQTNKENLMSKKDDNSDKTIKALENKIKALEFEFKDNLNNKLNSIEDKISNLNRTKIHERENYSVNQIENNIFFELNNQLKPLTSNALLIIDKKNKSEKKVLLIYKLIYFIIAFLFIYSLSVIISLSKNNDLNQLKIFGKDYLIKFLELVNYI
tara:strand:+ start:407 stop:1033 length:627 start_codon:yes stop_codon:yes gene_type:complete